MQQSCKHKRSENTTFHKTSFWKCFLSCSVIWNIKCMFYLLLMSNDYCFTCNVFRKVFFFKLKHKFTKKICYFHSVPRSALFITSAFLHGENLKIYIILLNKSSHSLIFQSQSAYSSHSLNIKEILSLCLTDHLLCNPPLRLFLIWVHWGVV